MIKVLVVDDDFMVAKVHQGFVQRLPGFEVRAVAYSAAGALTAVEQVRPDLVLLDIYLPDRSGLEVLRQLREGDIPVDVLAITAARDVGTIRTALRGGVVSYLIKPFTFEVLRDRLERYAAAHRRLAVSGEVAQDDVDRLLGTLRPSRTTLPKGLAAPTAELIGRTLRTTTGDLSAAECAQRSGVARVTARRYLEYLVMAGKAEVSLRYGGSGRPERRYRWLADSATGRSSVVVAERELAGPGPAAQAGDDAGQERQ